MSLCQATTTGELNGTMCDQPLGHDGPHRRTLFRGDEPIEWTDLVCPACGEQANHFDPDLGAAGEWTCVAIQYGGCVSFDSTTPKGTP